MSSTACNKLLLGADWALAHGDIGTVAHLTTQLSSRVSQPLSHELAALAELFRVDLDRATLRWPQLRARISAELSAKRI
jgi:hypothetical protein